ncbi:MAG TPA: alpha/beta fold hydrolase [Nocardioidaceae bacterium]|nr:alpha/beta fold hydrolase [Nocardioidaceae bacterium]
MQGEGEPLLLLNGLTRPLESWEPVSRELGGRMLVSLDLPGVGLSPTPPVPMSMEAMAALATEVLDHLGCTAVDVLGFSYGGAVAQQLAFDHAARVRRLVLAATSCGVGATPGSRHVLLEAASAYTSPSWPPPSSVGTMWQSLAICGWSAIPLLGALRMPTLVVCGGRDRVVPPTNSRLLASRIPGAELVVLPVAHDLQRGAAARMLAHVMGTFLAVHQAAPRGST